MQVGGWGLQPMIVLGVGIPFYYCCSCCVTVFSLLLFVCCVDVLFGVLLLLHACVFAMWLCIVGFVCV